MDISLLSASRAFAFNGTGLLVALALLTGCERKKAAPPPKPIRSVYVATAQARDVPLYFDTFGKCAAIESVVIQPQVTGAVTGVGFKDGEEVKKGDLLFTIDPRTYQAALAKAKAVLAEDRAKAEYAQLQVARHEELSKNKVIAAQEYDSLKSVAAAAAATVQADEAQVSAAQIDVDRCTLRSPIDGRASRRQIDIGNIVKANETELLLIQRQNPIHVDFNLNESDLPKLRAYAAKGTLKVEASFSDDAPGQPANAATKRREGAFDFLDNGVMKTTGAIRVRALLKNDDKLFWPGQFVNVRLIFDLLKAAVLVPNEALQTGQEGPFVFVVKLDKTVELRLVEPGQRHGTDVVISKGLQAGETVVVTGQISLAPGMPVKIAEKSAAEKADENSAKKD